MTIGSQLKQAREKKQVSIDDVYQQTRILPTMLTALEEDNFAKFSSTVYAKSFLKKYSSYLGLNPENILNEFSRLNAKEILSAPGAAAADKKPFALNIDMGKIKKALKVISKSILIILLLFIFVKTAGWLKHGFESWRSARIKQAERAVLAKPTQQNKIGSLPEAKKKPAVEIQKKSVKKASENASVPQDEKLTLSIKTTDDVWIELRRDGKIIFKNVLKKDSKENWEADEDFELWTGNAGAMNITLNGKDLGSPGVGVKRGIIINRQGIQR